MYFIFCFKFSNKKIVKGFIKKKYFLGIRSHEINISMIFYYISCRATENYILLSRNLLKKLYHNEHMRRQVSRFETTGYRRVSIAKLQKYFNFKNLLPPSFDRASILSSKGAITTYLSFVYKNKSVKLLFI